jgi:uncharacterized damage-inducible protein DinB
MTHLRRLLDYDVWANQQALASLGTGTPPARSLKWMAHIIAAECVWLARIRRESSPLPVWPDLSIVECRRWLADVSGQWPRLLDADEPSLEESVSYTNSQGEAWSSTVEEILTHVTVHSAYHRGQIASDLRAAGMTPAYTDYIHATRRGLV